MAANSRAASDPLTALLAQLAQSPDSLIRDWAKRLIAGQRTSSKNTRLR
jgi:hypothetical protein